MVKVKIPEWFGTGDLRVTINGKTVAVPIGKEIYVDENCADLIERLIEDRQKEVLTKEEILEKERENIGAASQKEMENLKGEVENIKANPQIKTLWTGVLINGELELKIPEETFYNNGKSIIAIVNGWSKNNDLYCSNAPLMMCFNFGGKEETGQYNPNGTDIYNPGYTIANNGVTKVGYAIDYARRKDFCGEWYLKEKNGERTMHIKNLAGSTVVTAIAVMRGDK